jgi:formylglycine-generating enzyme required for sulfatase activity
MRNLLAIAVLLLALPGIAHAEVTIDWITVGDPGNPADTEVMNDGTTGYGSVGYVYRIGKYEVTNAQYAEFLNGVAATDTFGLYNTDMGSGYGGITRSGSSGSYTYSTIAGRKDMPVNYVSWYDSLRFANWLHNGQPTGAQDSTTTEDGAYTMITESYPGGPFITRNSGATIFLTSEDEWYKAAYYDALSTSYFDYPTGTDTQTTCEAAPGGANSANCNNVVGDLTDVGSYTGSASPNGTFDQAGNVWEWNEALHNSTTRGERGGSFGIVFSPDDLMAWYRSDGHPTNEYDYLGFRVAMIPEPGTGLLVMTGMLGLAALRRRAV